MKMLIKSNILRLNSMKKIYWILIFLFFNIASYSQKSKVDSVFSFYFNVVEIYLADTLSPKDNPDWFAILYIDTISKDTVYINKYISEAVYFLTEITNISPQKTHKHYLTNTIDYKVLNLWKNWYIENKEKLIWSKRKNKPKVRCF